MFLLTSYCVEKGAKKKWIIRLMTARPASALSKFYVVGTPRKEVTSGKRRQCTTLREEEMLVVGEGQRP